MRLMFWEAYLAEFPEERAHGRPTGTIARWHRLPDSDLVLSLYFALDAVGAFIRGPRGAPPEMVYFELLPFATRLSTSLSMGIGAPESGYHFHRKRSADMTAFENWSDSIHWLRDTARLYEAAFV